MVRQAHQQVQQAHQQSSTDSLTGLSNHASTGSATAFGKMTAVNFPAPTLVTDSQLWVVKSCPFETKKKGSYEYMNK
jgi:hypothetical protein